MHQVDAPLKIAGHVIIKNLTRAEIDRQHREAAMVIPQANRVNQEDRPDKTTQQA